MRKIRERVFFVKNIWMQSTIITLFVFFMMWSVNGLLSLQLFTAFDVVGAALKDFELTDYAFSNLREAPLVDQRIVLVNIGRLSRGEIGQQIHIINQFKPRVIGIDVLFRCEGGLRDTFNCPQLLDTMGNMMLSAAIEEAGNVVLAHKLLQKNTSSQVDSNVFDSLEFSDDIFQKFAKRGFVNLPTGAVYQEDVKLCRSLFPALEINQQPELAFSTQIAMQYDSVKAKKYLARNNYEELINFRGNIEVNASANRVVARSKTATSNFATMFYAVDIGQLERGEILGEIFRDNIVMMGYMGNYLGDPSWEDKFFTPLNNKVAGRANPDMFGLVLHANVVAMILNEDFLNEFPEWALILFAFITCLLTVALLIYIDKKLPVWFDALSFFVQLVLFLLVSGLIITAFVQAKLKLDLSLTLAATALVGPCYDIFKSAQNELLKRFTNQPATVLKE